MTLRSGAARLLTMAGALGVGALLLAACGSKSDDARLTRTAYISQADALCAASNKGPAKPAADARAAAANANREASIRKNLVDKLSKLNPPRSLDGDTTIYLGQTDATITLYRKQARDAGNYQRFLHDDFGIAELLARREKTSLQIGFRACGHNPGVDGSNFDPNLIRAADAVCRPPNEAALGTTGPRPFSLGEFDKIAHSYDASLPLAQASVTKLRTLRASPAAQAQYARFLRSYAARVAITERQSQAAHAKDRTAFVAAGADDTKEQARESAAANQLGFEVCGNHGTAGV